VCVCVVIKMCVGVCCDQDVCGDVESGDSVVMYTETVEVLVEIVEKYLVVA